MLHLSSTIVGIWAPTLSYRIDFSERPPEQKNDLRIMNFIHLKKRIQHFMTYL